ncbi:aspartate kinase [Liquorilactobacillus satsumensis]|nr:aspartate kinase [Liquorilactobacillus satsumensis]MCC7665598.1 aspartate kinase [Liquorilactobacillus satsumensis]MCP9311810.1 aspartate kinase [Liquorilactobacillus satsumensis]MCP9328390.1 aspartate kinase [Liquorilactobacillus satsumensis]MCP9357356.1 aspartate kinase [Liquorilactobacillus satsumensis]MCP9358943.1 aspartate kinase [Liquorilactobacillus satsumensis]
MEIMVQKFGGTSVQDDAARHKALEHVRYAVSKGYKVVVVVSAIGRKGAPYATDSLLNLVKGEQTKLSHRELDMLVSVGEIISTAVFTELLKENGLAATAMTGADAGFRTDNEYQNAKVLDVKTEGIIKAFSQKDVVVVAGFQGLSREGHLATLGRGGSDTSAALLGAALSAKRVDIFTDVSGMMTGDPRIVKKARFLKNVSYEEVANMAHEGAKVVHPRAVEIAQQAHVPLRIRSTWDSVSEMGTLISDRDLSIQDYRSVTGIAHQVGLTQFSVSTAAYPADKIFNLLAANHLSVDFINILPEKVVFNLNHVQTLVAQELLAKAKITAEVINDCAKVSIVGAGIMGTPGITAKIVATLVKNKIEILQTTDSYTTIWVLVKQSDLNVAVNALHDTFLLNV